MPRYDYICECGEKFEESKPMEERENALCPECGQGVLLRRIPSDFSFTVKGL